MKQSRTRKEFLIDKTKGQTAERQFMELIAAMGGTAQALGTVPGLTGSTPKYSRPHENSETGYCFSVSPDIVITLPNQPKGFAAFAQVKIRKIYRERTKGLLYVFLDETELHRMNVANQFYDVYFVIYAPELTGINNFHDWMWIGVDQLHESINPLIKRKINGKPTFLVPLNIFHPMQEITRKAMNATANSNSCPIP